MTELCDYFKVWFPQVAELFDPSSGKRIVFESPETLAKGLLGKKPKSWFTSVLWWKSQNPWDRNHS